jgi:2,3-dihydroxyphenylpropionate 1,2-dioxygenase
VLIASTLLCRNACRLITALFRSGRKCSGTFVRSQLFPFSSMGRLPPCPPISVFDGSAESVGRFAASSGNRVLLAASGGLSHDPPVPSIGDADTELRERLINGRNPTREARRTGEERTLELGILAAAGKGPCMPLNPVWDGEFMAMLRSGHVAQADALDTDNVRVVAGRGANEALCWIAAFGALSAAGPYTVENEFYEAIPGWIAGFATMAGRQAR